MDAVIAGCGLSKRFHVRGSRDGAVQALGGVDLEVRPGEIVGLVGESGCGKSTLSRVLIGIETADGGEVRHDGSVVTTPAQWQALRRDVQYVFQDPYGSLPPKMRIGDTLKDPLRIHRIGDERERDERVRGVLDSVGLPQDAMSRRPRAFSGGQRQRISIARALVLEPRVVICDEVVSGLDVSVQAQVLNLLLDLQAKLGLGLLFISHDLRVIRYLCDRVCVMYRGEIVEQGETEPVFTAPQHAYTQMLLASSPERVAVGSRAPARADAAR